MKIRNICAVVLFLSLLTGVGYAGAHEYQAGKIVKVEKRESSGSSGGTDSQMKAEASRYRISIRLGDKVYVCSYQATSDADLSWVEGKDVEARVKGNAIYVKKSNGKEAKGSIVSTSPAENQ